MLVVENLMKNNRMTLQDIANLAGLNKMTVSRYLRDPNQVSQRSRELISKIMEENNYIPNRAPEILLNARSKTIGVLIPRFVIRSLPTCWRELNPSPRLASTRR